MGSVAVSEQATNCGATIPLVWGNAPETPERKDGNFEKNA